MWCIYIIVDNLLSPLEYGYVIYIWDLLQSLVETGHIGGQPSAAVTVTDGETVSFDVLIEKSFKFKFLRMHMYASLLLITNLCTVIWLCFV